MCLIINRILILPEPRREGYDGRKTKESRRKYKLVKT